MPDIFLSYSREDQATARRFAEGFEHAGFSVWWDQALNPGEAFDKVTEKALEEAKAVVVLWSKHSVDSRWVRSEAMQANSSGKLVPVMIEPCKRPIMFELTHTADLSAWNGDPNDRVWQDFIAGVRRFAKSSNPQDAVTAQLPLARPGRRTGVGVAIAVVAVLAVSAGIWALNRKGTETAVPATAVPVANAEVTLAVLPFADMSPAKDQEYFSDGLSEEILNQLAQVKNLAVTARTSSFSFKGKNEDVRVIGEKLGVDNLLEGSVRKDNNNLRITAQLLNSRSGAHLWSKTYDRELTGVFALQEEIAKDVAQALSIKLDVGDLPRSQGGTTSIEAYDKYLQAQAILRQEYTGERVTLADQLLREAVVLDPAFVSAWRTLAIALRNTSTWKPELTDTLRVEAANAEARVVTLAPESPLAQNVRLDQFMYQRKWSEAATAWKAVAASDAVGLDLRNGQASGFLSNVGRIKEAIVNLERQRQRDPLSLSLSSALQVVLGAAGRFADADAEYERSKDLVGDHGRTEHYALLRLMARKDAEPATVKARMRATLKRAPIAIDPGLLDKLGDPEAARAVVRRAFEDPANQEANRMGMISFYAGVFGDRDLALSAIRRGTVDLGGPPLTAWLFNAAGQRADPRFKDIVRDLGLVEYWRSSGDWGDFCKPVGKDDFECH